MGKVIPLMQRELAAYFFSPIAYAVLTIYLLCVGLLFLGMTFQPGAESSLRQLMGIMPLPLFIVLPIMTMRLLSEEFRSGTIETLMTAPVTEGDVVLGKFLGAVVFYLAMLASTLLFAFIIVAFGRLDWGLLLSTYLGLFLLGTLYIAVGMFFSACTTSQIIAAVGGIVVLGIFTFLADWLAGMVSGWPGLILHHLSIRAHYGDFIRGLVDTNHLVFFLTGTGLFLFLATKVLESRRWR